jgi:1-deoxy-D-xylulose-5-phosphate reductoisomerase
MDWTQNRSWQFFAPDFDKFRALKLAYEAQERGGSATCILNAADEVAVAAFLNGAIPFPAIAQTVEETLNREPIVEPRSIDEVIAADLGARRTAQAVVSEEKWLRT